MKETDRVYNERNRLVALLTSLYPAWKTRHPDSDESWDDEWRWIIGIHLSTGQATWHIHDSELPLFDHVPYRDIKWDGPSTEEKYKRISDEIRRRKEYGLIL